MRNGQRRRAAGSFRQIDVTVARDGPISYGPTAVINPKGTVVAQVPLLEPGMVVAGIGVPE